MFIVHVYSVSVYECALYSFRLYTRLDWGCCFGPVLKVCTSLLDVCPCLSPHPHAPPPE